MLESNRLLGTPAAGLRVSLNAALNAGLSAVLARVMSWAAAPTLALTLSLTFALTVSLTTGYATAREATPVSANPELDARVMALAAELRCLVCQNQTIADSHAGLAVDLRLQIREMLVKGQSEREVLDYMTQRYGDFVLYRPPFKSTTLLLWLAPGLLLVIALGSLAVVLRRRQRLGDEAFDPDVDDGEPAAGTLGASVAHPSPSSTAIHVQNR